MTTTYSKQGKASFRSKIIWGACSACVVVRRLLLILLLSAPLSALFTSCGHDDLVPPDIYVEDPEPPYIELKIAVPLANPSATRANPMGGEEGNGRERGLENEDKIHDFNLFFFEDEGGLNGSDETMLKQFYYSFDGDIQNNSRELESVDDNNGDKDPYYGIKYIKLKIQYWEDDIQNCKKWKFLALANFGKLSNISTLGQLRNLPLNEGTYNMQSWLKNDPFTKDASKYDHFYMSTAYEAETWFGGQSTGTNSIEDDGKSGYSGTTTVQRMYARLDLWYNYEKNAVLTTTGDNARVKELKYSVVDTKGNIVKDKEGENDFAEVYITNVLPVNVMQHPSFLFKRVTKDITSFIKVDLSSALSTEMYLWGGKESPSEGPFESNYNDRPTNYVMERTTTAKEIGGATSQTDLYTWYGESALHKVVDYIKPTNTNTDTDGHLSAYYDIGRVAAGMDPIYNYGNDEDYPCNRVSIIGYANENTHPTDCYHSNYLTGMAFRAIYVPNKIYRGSTTTTNADGTKNDSFVETTTVTEGKIYRYQKTNRTPKESYSIYFTTLEAAQVYDAAHTEDMGIITAYDAVEHEADGSKKWGFICYYNLWLRHYNNEAADYQDNFPMEYATVRNNIYRVSVSFSGPGDPTPTMREPDTMKARIFVRKWNYRKEDPIEF